jgi:3-phenylpropionate/trans-cinnamate dioxygenase ferredoxin reductase subunit
MSDPIVIAGGGPAAVAAVGGAREAGYAGQIVLISDEAGLPYRRPPLSKEYLTGEASAETLYVRPHDWFKEHDVELVLGTRVDRLDETTREVLLGDGSRLRYGKLLIATGGRPLKFSGLEHERVAYLRTIAEADTLTKRLRQGSPLVVLGAGFIGCEVAAAARKLGVEVTVLEMAGVPLHKALGDRFGAIMGEIHRDAGVDLRTGERVESIVSGTEGLLITTDKGRIEAGLLLVAVGLRPNTEIAAGTTVRADNGILTDEFCQTSVPDVYAAGDVAAHLHPVYGRVRVEHYDNALKQGAVAGRNLVANDPVPYTENHWFWSDQFEHNLQSLGLPAPNAEFILRGSIAEREFSAWTIGGGTVASVFTMNRTKDIVAAKRLIATKTQVTAEQLSDESTDLRQLAKRR